MSERKRRVRKSMETWPRLGLLQRDGSVRHCVHTAWGFPQEGATAGRRPSPRVLLLNRCLQGGRRNPKLSSTATAGGAEHGVPGYFSDSGKQQRLHSGNEVQVWLCLRKQLREFASCGGRGALLPGGIRGRLQQAMEEPGEARSQQLPG